MKNPELHLIDTGFAQRWMRNIQHVLLPGLAGNTATDAANDAVNSDSIRKAEDTLNRLSDRELRDIGISRGEIAFVVRNGRPGFDDQPRPPRHVA